MYWLISLGVWIRTYLYLWQGARYLLGFISHSFLTNLLEFTKPITLLKLLLITNNPEPVVDLELIIKTNASLC